MHRPNMHIADIPEPIEEMGQNIYINFIDFRKVFDSVVREKMWKILRFISTTGKRYKSYDIQNCLKKF